MNAIEIYENAIRMLEINGEITLGEFEDMIKPLEDVAPVVHGEWTECEVVQEHGDEPIIDEWQSARCSVCGKYHTTPYMYYFDKFNYCPNCGAKMEIKKGDKNGI